MEDKSPARPEKPVHSPETAPKKFVLSKTLLALLLVVILVLAGIIIFLFKQSTNVPIATTQPTQTITTAPQLIKTTPSEWKTYTNTDAGFSLQYPSSVLINGELQGAKQIVLSVNAEKLASIPEEGLNLGLAYALKEKDLLTKGEGKNVVKVGSLNGRTETILNQLDSCSMIFYKKLTFFPGQYRVIISLTGPKDAIMGNMPEFFQVDPSNCGTEQMWKFEKIAEFEPTLEKKQGKGMAQEWYDTFDQVIKTVTLTTPSNTPSNDLSVYKSEKYGFEISYPKPYKALDSKDDLSGYPNGAVLIYKGGQAYDVVIEVWNTQSEYESNYSSRMTDITVVKNKDKFITLLNNTQDPENAKIIASFKLLP